MIEEVNNQETGYLSIVRGYLMELLVLTSRYNIKHGNANHETHSDKKIRYY